MLYGILYRGLHRAVANCCSAQIAKSQLFKLRKRTGFPISSCKKALEVNDNDVKKAFEWLTQQAQKEGWTKAQKLQGRSTTQGLIGIQAEDNVAAMVEVNCETDFVSRNQEFKNLVLAVAKACHSYTQKLEMKDNLVKISLVTEHLATLPWPEQLDKTLIDFAAMKIGQLGENIKLLRAVGIKVPKDFGISCYVHPPEDSASNISSGKYGSLIVVRRLKSESEIDNRLSVEACGRQLCQHVVGMNPMTIGEKTDEPMEDKDEETKMIHQEFLIDPMINVSDFLEQNNIQIVDFVRFECGETNEDLL